MFRNSRASTSLTSTDGTDQLVEVVAEAVVVVNEQYGWRHAKTTIEPSNAEGIVHGDALIARRPAWLFVHGL